MTDGIEWTETYVRDDGEPWPAEVDCVTLMQLGNATHIPHLVNGLRDGVGTDGDEVIDWSFDQGETWEREAA